MVPLGFLMTMGEAVVQRLVTGKSWKKWAVLPVSAMMLGVALFGGMVAGGKTGGSTKGGSAK
jgi:hypothetical protein